MLGFWRAFIARAFEHTRRGLAFNAMSSEVEWTRDDLFHLPFDVMASFVARAAESRLRGSPRLRALRVHGLRVSVSPPPQYPQPMPTAIVGGALAEQARQRWRGVGSARVGARAPAARLRCLVRRADRARGLRRRGRGSGPVRELDEPRVLRARFRRDSGSPTQRRSCAARSRRRPGRPYGSLLDRAAEADLLINISGNIRATSFSSGRGPPSTSTSIRASPRLWHAAGTPGLRLDDHDHHVTVGLNIGRPVAARCRRGHRVAARPCPRCSSKSGRPDLAARGAGGSLRWPLGESRTAAVEIDGEPQAAEAPRVPRAFELPQRAPSLEFEIALDDPPGDAADLAALRSHGWRIVDPRAAVTRDPGSYRDYVQGSAAEFSAARAFT